MDRVDQHPSPAEMARSNSIYDGSFHLIRRILRIGRIGVTAGSRHSASIFWGEQRKSRATV